MADITGQSLVTLALANAGVVAAGVQPQAIDLANALTLLNMMLGQWQRRRYLVYRLADLSCASTGAPAYSVGPGGDIVVDQRPDQIEGAYARFLRSGPASVEGDYDGTDTQAELTPAQLGYGAGAQPLDFRLGLIASREDWSGIGMKGLSTWPSAVYYDPDIPLGKLYVWPIPIAGIWELHILVKQSLVQLASLASNLGLPPEYQEAVLYNLMVRLRPAYGLDPDPVVSMLAAASLATLRAANSSIARLSPNLPLGRRGQGVYWPGLEASNAVGISNSDIGGFAIGVSSIG